MLPFLVLLVVQIAAAVLLADPLKSVLGSFVSSTGSASLFITAVAYALIITVIGFAGALVLKGLRVPTVGTFLASLVLALILAAIPLIPQIYTPLQTSVPLIATRPYLLPLIGAVVGYLLKR